MAFPPRSSVRWLPARARTWLALAVLSSGLLVSAPAFGNSIVDPQVASAALARPNVVVIVTDDHRWDMIDRMPNLRTQLLAQGATFSQAFVVNSLCCPSRAAMLTGGYSHTTGVYSNGGTYGGFHSFEDASTLATWLDDVGYRTGLVGKYFNGYADGSYIPPGWDTWDAFTGPPRYYNYSMTIDGTARAFGSSEQDYSTDVLAGMADAFIRADASEEPLFLWFAPYAPHTKAIPAPRHVDALSDFPRSFPPNLNEADVSDKPAWVQALELSTVSGNSTRRQQYRTLLAADDAIGTVVEALSDTGRLSSTLIVFIGDNGWSQGSHRWRGKEVPWEESIRVPLIIRYDPLTGGVGRTDPHAALNVDIAQTVAEIAGVAAPGAEGFSLAPLLGGSYEGSWREDFLIEHLRTSTRAVIPTYCAVRTSTAKYIRYSTGEEELYDLVADPFELESLHDDSAYAGLLRSMRLRLAELCSPPPPGYSL
jgi:arylsulfatase A-like enzyme